MEDACSNPALTVVKILLLFFLTDGARLWVLIQIQDSFCLYLAASLLKHGNTKTKLKKELLNEASVGSGEDTCH